RAAAFQAVAIRVAIEANTGGRMAASRTAFHAQTATARTLADARGDTAKPLVTRWGPFPPATADRSGRPRRTVPAGHGGPFRPARLPVSRIVQEPRETFAPKDGKHRATGRLGAGRLGLARRGELLSNCATSRRQLPPTARWRPDQS